MVKKLERNFFFLYVFYERMIIMKKKGGFTLLELVITISISTMVIATAFNVFFAGVKSQDMNSKEFDEQAEIRYSIQTINNSVRFSSVAFAVTEDDYKPQIDESGEVSGLAKPWNYIGLNEDKTSLVNYVFEGTKYKEYILAKAPEGTTYKISFIKDSYAQDDNLVRFILEGHNKNGEKFKINTELEALNSIHVIDWGDLNKRSIALAYRTEDTPEINKKPLAAMAMVLDNSGSMTLKVNGTGTSNLTSPPNDSRIEILKRSLKKMVGDLKKGENVYASLIPFSTNANIPHENFSNPPSNPSDFRIIDKKENNDWNNLIDSLRAQNGTNTGDGMRRGYYQLLNFNNHIDNKDKTILNYMVIMVDGVTTMASADVFNNRDYIFIVKNGNVSSTWYTDSPRNEVYTGKPQNKNVIIGKGNELDTKASNYVYRIGEGLIQAKNLPSGTKDLNLKGNVFVIGFSSKPDDLRSVKDIAKAVGIKVEANNSDVDNDFKNNDRVFIAKSENDLEGVFTNIGGIIMEELWQVEGPRLKN